MKLSDTVAEQLRQLNYNVSSLDELFNLLPEVISTRIGKSIKRTPAIFLLTIEEQKYSLSLAEKNGENEPVILQKGMSRNIYDVVGKMIIYLNRSGLLTGD